MIVSICRDTFYSATCVGGGAEGYIDYPSMDGTVGVQGKYQLMPQDKIGSRLPAKL